MIFFSATSLIMVLTFRKGYCSSAHHKNIARTPLKTNCKTNELLLSSLRFNSTATNSSNTMTFYISLSEFLRRAKCFFIAVSCGVPKAPENGGVLAVDYSVGTRVTYFCNDGYRLSSKELTSASCQPDGTWSNHNKIPRCSGIRPLSLSLTHTHT